LRLIVFTTGLWKARLSKAFNKSFVGKKVMQVKKKKLLQLLTI